MGIDNQTTNKNAIENEDLFNHITKINFLHIGNKFVQSQIGLVEHQLKNRQHASSIFNRMAAAYFDVEGITEQGEKIPFIVQIYAKTFINLFDKDIIENIRRNGSLDLLDLEWTYSPEINDYTEYIFGDKPFFKRIKNKVIAGIQEDSEMEHSIVENYCDILDLSLNQIEKTKKILPELENIQKELVDIVSANTGEREEGLINNNRFRELKARKEYLYGKLSTWRPLELKLYMDTIEGCGLHIYENMLKPIEQGKKIIPINTKYFYMDNGDALYNAIAEQGEYRKYYEAELDLLEHTKKVMGPYVHKHYISLGCGNGKKDKLIIEAAKTEYNKKNIQGQNNEIPFAAYQDVLLMDSSLKALKEAGKVFEKEFPIIQKQFSVGRINDILEKGRLYSNLRASEESGALLFQNTIYIEELRNLKKTMTLFGGTFGNFGSYQIPFLQQMDKIMQEGDIFIVSLFNKAKNEAQKKQIENIYNTEEERAFIANFFQKIGIKKDNIILYVWYDENDIINVDVKIERQGGIPAIARVGGKIVEIPDGTIFQCFTSERFNKDTFNDLVERNTNLTIKNQITEKDNPFTFYVLEKNPENGKKQE